MANGISVSAILVGIKTMQDGGWRVTFDIDDSQSQQVLQLSQFREDLLHMDIGKPVLSDDLLGLTKMDL